MKILVIVMMLMASIANIYAQSCCCTGVSGNYSVLPNLDKHVIGLRYSYASYNTTITHLFVHKMGGKDMIMTGADEEGIATMNTVDVFGRFNIHKGLQLSVFLPVHVLSQKTADQLQRSSGLGDMSFLLQYAVLDPQKCNGKTSKHQLRLGAGLKLPSGQFSMKPDIRIPSELQLGTGSIDFIFNAIYTYRYKKFGLNASSAYKLN